MARPDDDRYAETTRKTVDLSLAIFISFQLLFKKPGSYVTVRFVLARFYVSTALLTLPFP